MKQIAKLENAALLNEVILWTLAEIENGKQTRLNEEQLRAACDLFFGENQGGIVWPTPRDVRAAAARHAEEEILLGKAV